MLSKEFILPRLMPKSSGETFRGVQARRMDSDYGDYVEIGIEDEQDSLARPAVFVERAAEIIEQAAAEGTDKKDDI